MKLARQRNDVDYQAGDEVQLRCDAHRPRRWYRVDDIVPGSGIRLSIHESNLCPCTACENQRVGSPPDEDGYYPDGWMGVLAPSKVRRTGEPTDLLELLAMTERGMSPPAQAAALRAPDEPGIRLDRQGLPADRTGYDGARR